MMVVCNSFWGDGYTVQPYASGREIWVQKFRNAYQWKEHLYHWVHQRSSHATNVCFPFTYLRMFRERLCRALFEACGVFLCVYAVRMASFVLLTSSFFMHNICRQPLCMGSSLGLWSSNVSGTVLTTLQSSCTSCCIKLSSVSHLEQKKTHTLYNNP